MELGMVWGRPTAMRATTALVAVVVLVSGCGQRSTVGVVEVDDPEGLIVSVTWLERSPELEIPLPDEQRPAVLLPGSEPTRLIAVSGSTCRPRIDLRVMDYQQPAFDLLLTPGVPSRGACGDYWTMHPFALDLSSPVDVDAVVLTATELPAP